MAHDPGRVAEARAWIVRAARDLRAAEHEFQAVPPLLDDIVFHCQQAAEKALKGFLTWHDRPFRKTHSIEEIGEQSLAVDPRGQERIEARLPRADVSGARAVPHGYQVIVGERTNVLCRKRQHGGGLT